MFYQDERMKKRKLLKFRIILIILSNQRL